MEYADMASLVRVRSFLGVAEAELARIRLAMDGISARLSNAELVIWFWHYSNVTGGVKLFVKESDLPQAAIILSPQPVPLQFQPPRWICPKCRADVDGQWSFCWSCGTSKTGEEDPDFHTWYRDLSNGSLAGKTYTNVIAAIISVLYLVLFLVFKGSLSIVVAWLSTLTLWVLISRFLSLHKTPMFNAAELESEGDNFSATYYDPARDEFSPADDIAYKLWKAAVFSIYSLILFFFAIWFWFKIQKVASSLSQKGCRHYYYSSLIIILIIMLYGWMTLWLISNHIVLLGSRLF
jgi:hypothetical protein